MADDATKIVLDASQESAVAHAITAPMSIITGGAGSGKTTIIRQITERLEAAGETVYLCAFAGKAAARVREATDHEASTIHRLLKWNGERFTVGSLRDGTVIADEASMISSSLLAEIVRRSPRRLVLVGDEAQLPPVGSGQPFHDLIRMQPGLVSNLTTCYRSRQAVFKAASIIRRGEIPARVDRTSEETWEMRETGGARTTHECILGMVRAGEIDFRRDIILSPRNEDESNSAAAITPLNRDIVNIVNPRPAGERFLPGDRVINTKNNAELDIWNGTTGTVQAIDPGGRMHIVTDFPVRPNGGEPTTDVEIPRDFVSNFSLAYALTVHKSQGSQYRKVIFVVLSRDAYALLDRAMIYTGVTRAKAECLVIGELGAFTTAIRHQTKKHTAMQRIHQILGA